MLLKQAPEIAGMWGGMIIRVFNSRPIARTQRLSSLEGRELQADYRECSQWTCFARAVEALLVSFAISG